MSQKKRVLSQCSLKLDKMLNKYNLQIPAKYEPVQSETQVMEAGQGEGKQVKPET